MYFHNEVFNILTKIFLIENQQYGQFAVKMIR